MTPVVATATELQFYAPLLAKDRPDAVGLRTERLPRGF